MPTDLRLAACDVGSNAVRLVVARVLGERPCILQQEAQYRVPLRLGDDVFSHGLIAEDKAQSLVDAFKAFRLLLGIFKPAKFRACATSAMREAENGALLAERVWEEAGIRLELITGAEEARALIANAPSTSLLPDLRSLYVDVGGGSTEVTLFAQGRVIRSASFRIGGVRLLGNRVEDSEWLRLQAWFAEIPELIRPTEAIGSGGNLSKLYDLSGSKKQALSRERLGELVTTLAPLSVEERIRAFGLKPDRADVIVPAGRIYGQILDWAGLDTIAVPKLGLIDGLLSQLYEEQLGYPPPAQTGRAATERD
jgi:exopolyphosphatase / guanosine-5'-triphosphate,3'-diphosphate pyrophosphatase